MQAAFKALLRTRACRKLWRMIDAVGGYVKATMEAGDFVGDVA